MAVFRCKMCGGDLLMAEGASTCTCEYCGTEQTVPSIKDENLQGLFNRANVLRMKAEFDKAEEIYEKILQVDETEAEAYWGLILCKYGIEYVEDPATFKRIPTCHRTSYDAIMADEDYKNALKYADTIQRGIYEAEAKAIDEIQKGILSISQKEDPYDVFICYKETNENGKRTQDSVIANDIYYQLTQEGYKVFYAAISLEDKLGSEYEPYIFSALTTAKVMLCLGTRPEYFSAAWVKNEWSRFLRLMKKDRTKLLIPCYRDMDAYELPEEFAHLQAQDMSKIGFINDLIRGIRKVVSKETEIPTFKEPAAERGNMTNTAPLLRRAFMFLEDGDWKRADEFCEQVLNLEPENAQAYVGKLMAKLNVNIQDELANCEEPFDDQNSYRKAVKFASPKLREKLEGYVKLIKDRNETERLNGLYAEAERKYGTARTEKEYKEAASVYRSIAEWKDSRERAEEALKKAEETRKQAIYGEAVRQAGLNQIAAYKKAIELLKSLKGWKDSDEKIAEYETAIRELAEKEEAERREKAKKAEKERLERERHAERMRQAEKAARKKRRQLGIAACLIVFASVAIFVVGKQVVIPNNQYRKAEKLLLAGNYDEAIAAFGKLGDYKDAADRVEEARYAKAEGILASGDYDGAIAAFTELGDYKDAADRAEETKTKMFYDEAETLEDNGEIVKAALAYGKLGDYSDAREKSFLLWDQVACRNTIVEGYYYMLGLRSDGTVVAVGNNEVGQCDVSDWTDIIAIAAGLYHTIGLKSDGIVEAVGSNSSGQCEVSDWTDIVAVAAGDFHTVGLKSDGTVAAAGWNEDNQCDVSDWTDIIAIAASSDHTVGLKSDGAVVAVGENDHGQCDVSDWTDIVTVATNWYHTIGLKSDGAVVAVGKNDDGQCNVSDWTDIIAIAEGYYHTVGLKSDGTVIAVGNNAWGQCNVSGWTDIIAVMAGSFYTIGLKSDGTVVATGGYWNEQLDVSGWSDIKIPGKSF